MMLLLLTANQSLSDFDFIIINAQAGFGSHTNVDVTVDSSRATEKEKWKKVIEQEKRANAMPPFAAYCDNIIPKKNNISYRK